MFKLCQLEFQSSDIEGTLNFTENVLDWKKVPVSIQDQVIIEVPDDSPYGISLKSVKSPTEGGPLTYFQSTVPLENLLRKIKESGGEILEDPKFVTGYGQVMIVKAPGQVKLGLFYEMGR